MVSYFDMNHRFVQFKLMKKDGRILKKENELLN